MQINLLHFYKQQNALPPEAPLEAHEVPDWSATIQQAIGQFPSYVPGQVASVGGELFFPNGIYRITQPIAIRNSKVTALNPVGWRQNITLRGENAAASAGWGSCVLLWAGRSDEVMLNLFSAGCSIERIAFRVSDEVAGCHAAIHVDHPHLDDPELQAGDFENGTTHSFDRVRIGHPNITFRQAKFEYGIIVGSSGGYRFTDGNLENLVFRQCDFRNIQQACFFIASRSGQSKHHSFYDCTFTFARLGIHTNSGSFQTYTCSFGRMWQAAIWLLADTDNIALFDTDSEACTRFLVAEGSASTYAPVMLCGGRFGTDSVLHIEDDEYRESQRTATDPAIGSYIQFRQGGQLTVQGCLFESYGSPHSLAFHISLEGRAVPGVTFCAIGNGFPNANPVKQTGSVTVTMLANTGWKNGQFFHLRNKI